MKRKNFICFCAIGMMAAFCTACGAETTEPVTVETIDWNQNNGEQEQVTAVETIPFSAMDSAEWESQDDMTSDGTIADDYSDEDDYEYEGDATTYYNDCFSAVLDNYYTALSKQWDEGQLYSEEMSVLISYCYEENPLENVGYAYVDVNNDGSWELLIGAIAGDEFVDKVIFDLYALEDDVPVQVFCSQERDRYYLCEEETGGYEIANAGSSGAALSAWHYYILNGQEMQVVQAIIYDGMTDPENPWYMAYDEDWDTTNDTHVDEKMAEDIIESYENQYTQPDYMSFAYYK